jgi:hypothetical protein
MVPKQTDAQILEELLAAKDAEQGVSRPEIRIAPEGSIGKVFFNREAYDLLSELGSGPTGEVFVAQNRKSGRKYNLAIHRRMTVGDRRAAMIEAAKRQGPLLRNVDGFAQQMYHGFGYLFGQTEARYIEIIKPQEGVNLVKAIHDHGRFSEREARDLAEKLLIMTGELHRNSLLNGGIESNNILITKDNGLYQLDVGTIRSRNSKTQGGAELRVTLEDEGDKSLAYTAPEQIAGARTEASDMYGIGGVLWFALTGEHPEALEYTERHRDRFDRERLERLELSPAFVDFIGKTRKMDHNERQQSVRDALSELRSISGLPVATQHQTTSVIAWKAGRYADSGPAMQMVYQFAKAPAVFSRDLRRNASAFLKNAGQFAGYALLSVVSFMGYQAQEWRRRHTKEGDSRALAVTRDSDIIDGLASAYERIRPTFEGMGREGTKLYWRITEGFFRQLRREWGSPEVAGASRGEIYSVVDAENLRESLKHSNEEDSIFVNGVQVLSTSHYETTWPGADPTYSVSVEGRYDGQDITCIFDAKSERDALNIQTNLLGQELWLMGTKTRNGNGLHIIDYGSAIKESQLNVTY